MTPAGVIAATKGHVQLRNSVLRWTDASYGLGVASRHMMPMLLELPSLKLRATRSAKPLQSHFGTLAAGCQPIEMTHPPRLGAACVALQIRLHRTHYVEYELA